MTASETPLVAHPDDIPPIRLRIQRLDQLFHTLDPFPFRERGLGAQVEEYVVGWVRELGARGRLTISIHVPAAQARAEVAAQVAEARLEVVEEGDSPPVAS